MRSAPRALRAGFAVCHDTRQSQRSHRGLPETASECGGAETVAFVAARSCEDGREAALVFAVEAGSSGAVRQRSDGGGPGVSGWTVGPPEVNCHGNDSCGSWSGSRCPRTSV